MASAKLTPLGIAVLELLHERPMHPYEMAALMRERYVDTRVNVKAGSLYHTVERLHRSGFIEVVDTQRDGRRPERTVYGMTQTGLDEFNQRARELLGDVATEFPAYLSGLAVIDELGREASLNELETRLMRLRAAVASDRAVQQRLTENQVPEIYWLDWRYQCDHRLFELEWTERLAEDLRSGRIPFQDHQPPKLTLITREDDDERKTS
ncbi:MULTISPECIES: PadR family transcriptional regulator [unclassified Amycolatopsis]|uniref:PadR family transcriptional regulator n=1 Tax=unclassified Amycolatopsis TaxID=2618356 RepID=UPI002876F3E2|nr:MULTISPECIES: PadR family transcriptional regulator [unclassified Amycolatopsis]MDS0135194.1 PadR family transcriptional regulator [Amycolatopsis sp. 505]MDS0143029.1 PadR family transcriptional regulator [Amycolatopsis sp. CM201R]